LPLLSGSAFPILFYRRQASSLFARQFLCILYKVPDVFQTVQAGEPEPVNKNSRCKLYSCFFALFALNLFKIGYRFYASFIT